MTTFLSRLVESTRSLVIGDPADPGTDVGPVIDEAGGRQDPPVYRPRPQRGPPGVGLRGARGTGRADRQAARRAAHLFRHRAAAPPGPRGDFRPGACPSSARPTSTRPWKWPTPRSYKLTGGVFSRRPSHLEAARRRFRVGNLYLNRGITGALVGRQPFGGFGLSGTGTKAGGRRLPAALRRAALPGGEHHASRFRPGGLAPTVPPPVSFRPLGRWASRNAKAPRSYDRGAFLDKIRQHLLSHFWYYHRS